MYSYITCVPRTLYVTKFPQHSSVVFFYYYYSYKPLKHMIFYLYSLLALITNSI